MYSSQKILRKYLQYQWRALNGKGHGVHSPFLYDLVQQVLNAKAIPGQWEAFEKRRKLYLKNSTPLQVQDFGAGSRVGASQTRTISEIAARSLKPKKYGQLLHHMIAHYGHTHLLELGTSLGITSCYMASANPLAVLHTLEGAQSVAEVASQGFKALGLQNIQLVQGSFDNTLSPVLQSMQQVDFAYIDGNHRYEPTIQYFENILPYTHSKSMLVFDDIHWSQEMESAWFDIKHHAAVTCSVDLFFLGLIVFDTSFSQPLHVSIRY